MAGTSLRTIWLVTYRPLHDVSLSFVIASVPAPLEFVLESRSQRDLPRTFVDIFVLSFTFVSSIPLATARL